MDETNITINKIIKSKRRTLAIEIDKTGEVIVKAPLSISNYSINDFINQKKNWIISKQYLIKNRIIESEQLKENKALFFGFFINIEFIIDKKNVLQFNNNTLYIDDKYRNDYRKILRYWYIINARKYLIHRTNELARIYNFQINNIRINNAKGSWGSCSSKKNINLNWRLIMADKSISDYVIIHELVHTKVMNHSKNFWNLVEQIIPNYKEIRQNLKNIAHLLDE